VPKLTAPPRIPFKGYGLLEKVCMGEKNAEGWGTGLKDEG